MARFHDICDDEIQLSKNRTVARTLGEDKTTLFSADTLLPGEPFFIKVINEYVSHEYGALWLGVTEQSPEEWRDNGQSSPKEMSRTWCMGTADGYTWTHGTDSGVSEAWCKRFMSLILSDDDDMSVTLCCDRSLSIMHNDLEVRQVITGLPDKPLRLVIEMEATEIAVVNSGCESLENLTLQTLAAIIPRKKLRKVMIPRFMRNTIADWY